MLETCFFVHYTTYTMVRELTQATLFDDTPRGILEALLIAGGITVALTATPALLLALGGIGFALNANDKIRRRKLASYGAYLKRRNYIAIKAISRNRLRVSLSPLGRRRALSARTRRLLSKPISRPKKWDDKWRLILFDIATEDRRKRDAFRTFIRKIGATMLQKSVWVYPYDCSEHILLLRDFFDFSKKELRIVLAENIESDGDLR